jgi:hypothetical protein
MGPLRRPHAAGGALRCHITRGGQATFVRYVVDDVGLLLPVDPDMDLTDLCAALDTAIEG